MQLAFPGKFIACYQGFWKDILRGIFFNREEIDLICKFEKRFAEYMGVKFAIAVSSGRWALYLILKNINLKETDEVILPAITHSSIPSLIRKIGAQPIFVDFLADSFELDLNQLIKKINVKTRVIIATHIFGIPSNIEQIMGIAKEKNIEVIEDCAHGIGVKVGGRQVGGFGRAAFFSFETTKLINTLGGGMVVTNDINLYNNIKQDINAYRSPSRIEIFKKVLRFCVHKLYANRLFFSIAALPAISFLDKFNIDLLKSYKKIRKANLSNYKTKFTNMQAVLGLKQLDIMEENSSKITANVRFLEERLNCSGVAAVKSYSRDIKKVQYLFTLLIENKRDSFYKLLLKKGINSERGILEICPPSFGYPDGFDNSDNLAKKALQLSINSDLNEKDILYIANTINEISRNLNAEQ